MAPSASSNLSLKIRNAISKSLPCAYDQYLTLSIPGRLIGPEFIAANTSASAINQVRVSEARLVDSMIPLSSVMLGPSGKSVARSYLSALNHLVPYAAGIEKGEVPEDSKKASEQYAAAIKFLQKPAAITSVKDTFLGIYIDMQQRYSAAQVALENVLIKNSELLSTGATAAQLSSADTALKSAQSHLQAIWMEWVVCGNKVAIDNHFAIVDTTTIMARIETAKKAQRSAIITDYEDGTEWSRVTLAPSDWADRCKQKADSWISSFPVSTAAIEKEITRLENVKKMIEATIKWLNTYPSSGAQYTETNSEMRTLITRSTTGDDKDQKNAEQLLKEKRQKILNSAVESTGYHDADGLIKHLNTQKERVSSDIIKLQNREEGVPTGPSSSDIVWKSEDTGKAWSLVRSKDIAYTNPALLAVKHPDAWVKITFETTEEENKQALSASHNSASGGVSVGSWFASASASTSVSKATSKMRDILSSSAIKGSFSAMLVQISRPWLQSEIFEDYDIDTPITAKLSPGATKLNELLQGDSTGLSDYGLFPWYPTAFIVCADTTLEVSCTSEQTTAFSDSLKTDSSISVGYGPWSASAHGTTNDANSGFSYHVSGNSITISFGAPQIIGWVSEMLPELPRNRKIGGMNKTPVTWYKS